MRPHKKTNKELNRDILEYFSNNKLPKVAEAFAEETGIVLPDIDPEGKRFEMKWKAIKSL